MGNWSGFLNMLILFYGFPVDGRLLMNSNFSSFLQEAVLSPHKPAVQQMCGVKIQKTFIGPGGSHPVGNKPGHHVRERRDPSSGRHSV